jgi:hypothetical protein
VRVYLWVSTDDGKMKIISRSKTSNLHTVISHSMHSHSTPCTPPVEHDVSALRGASLLVTAASFEEEIEVGRGVICFWIGSFQIFVALSYSLGSFSAMSQVPIQKRFLLARSLIFAAYRPHFLIAHASIMDFTGGGIGIVVGYTFLISITLFNSGSHGAFS